MKVIKPGPDREVPRGVVGGAEISQATAGARNIYMGLFRVPAGAQSRPHYHEGCESARLHAVGGAARSSGATTSRSSSTLEPGRHASTCRRARPTCSRTRRRPSPPSTWWRGTRRTRTRSSSRGPSSRDRVPAGRRSPAPAAVEIFWRAWAARRRTARRVVVHRARRRRAQRALRATWPPAWSPMATPSTRSTTAATAARRAHAR